MKSFKTLNLIQVSAIYSCPLSIIQSTECPIPPAHCTALALQIALQHNEPLMWSDALVLLQDRSQTSRIWFWSWSWSCKLCSWSWACCAGL